MTVCQNSRIPSVFLKKMVIEFCMVMTGTGLKILLFDIYFSIYTFQFFLLKNYISGLKTFAFLDVLL